MKRLKISGLKPAASPSLYWFNCLKCSSSSVFTWMELWASPLWYMATNIYSSWSSSWGWQHLLLFPMWWTFSERDLSQDSLWNNAGPSFYRTCVRGSWLTCIPLFSSSFTSVTLAILPSEKTPWVTVALQSEILMIRWVSPKRRVSSPVSVNVLCLKFPPTLS